MNINSQKAFFLAILISTIFKPLICKAQLQVIANGNVGIGTTSPGTALDVQIGTSPSIRAQGSSNPYLQVVSTNGALITKCQSVATVGGYVGTQSNHNLFLCTDNEPSITILANGGNPGTVGIANTAPNTSYALDVAGDINSSTHLRASGVILTSDRKFKTNIVPIPNAMAIIKQLKPSSYYWDSINAYGMHFENQKQYGLISQDVEKVLPELIYNSIKLATHDSAGNVLTQAVSYKGLNYNAFIPILIKGLQEQQVIIERLDSINKALQSQVTTCCNSQQGQGTTSVTGDNLNNTNATAGNSSAILYQNIPNPFSQQTSIGYSIPTSAQSASIIIFDLQGKLIKTVSVFNFGTGSIRINGSELAPGMYVYSLLVDGKIIDSKRMILTQ